MVETTLGGWGERQEMCLISRTCSHVETTFPSFILIELPFLYSSDRLDSEEGPYQDPEKFCQTSDLLPDNFFFENSDIPQGYLDRFLENF